jgi:hypothetical protein
MLQTEWYTDTHRSYYKEGKGFSKSTYCFLESEVNIAHTAKLWKTNDGRYNLCIGEKSNLFDTEKEALAAAKKKLENNA